MPEVEIIRKEIFTVDHCETDDYGNMTVTDHAGGTHKVNAKHKAIHPVFEPGIAVEVGYGEYMQKEFIHTARQVKDGLSAPVVSKGAIEIQKVINVSSGKNKAFALSYAKDIGVAIIGQGKECSTKKVIEIAKEFQEYMDS